MVDTLILDAEEKQQYSRMLRPEPLPDGSEPEERVIVCGLSWQQYLDFDQALGDDRSAPRLYFNHGELEIMTVSSEHERLKKVLASFVELSLDHSGVKIFATGQATLRKHADLVSAEPDESWSLASPKEVPDLVLEIALNTGGERKLAIYRAFAIPEVWIWRREKLEFYLFRSEDTGYRRAPRSVLLPEFDPTIAERCAKIECYSDARAAFRESLS